MTLTSPKTLATGPVLTALFVLFVGNGSSASYVSIDADIHSHYLEDEHYLQEATPQHSPKLQTAAKLISSVEFRSTFKWKIPEAQELWYHLFDRHDKFKVLVLALRTPAPSTAPFLPLLCAFVVAASSLRPSSSGADSVSLVSLIYVSDLIFFTRLCRALCNVYCVLTVRRSWCICYKR